MADPLAILGAVAASLQLAVYAIKGPVGTVELVQSLHEAPRRMSLLLSQIDREVASTNNLLRFDPPIHPYLSTTQYAQISTLAVEARKAMESIQEDLRPLVEAIQSASEPSEKRKVLIQAWKSVATIKKEKEIESKMKLLERLNVSLLRELHIAGFETQSLLR
ncbi:uncharacterized protein F4822DRAFT_417863 [Hypoxylon trugodes]|uniref:uncharacterized protein n=1 Tax=Hypoxylon trugodes TaxID=326681 RepID=UPI00218F8256|nr:uncharacterized protein F4822DRAFT_417863 [Hypoxylon trugodes]KAI1383868.1 hypothetical protein F4822DRAFT_417863 [Hypoxylon trugodes]